MKNCCISLLSAIQLNDCLETVQDTVSIVTKTLLFMTSCLICRSKDDPFMLYAALYFGQQTYIVSKDQMRDHRFVLGPELASRLMQWQRQRQITFTGRRNTGRFYFKVNSIVLNKDWF